MAILPKTWQAATIASGATTSGAIDLGEDAERAIIALPDMTGVTASVTVAPGTADTYTTLDKPDGGGSLQLPKSRAHVVTLGAARYIKIVSSDTEGAERTISVRGV